MTTITGRIKKEPNVSNPKAAGDVLLYKYVEPDRIPVHVRKRARKYTDRLARELSLGHVRVRWMRHVASIPPPAPRVVDDGDGPVEVYDLDLLGHDVAEADFYGVATEPGELRLGLAPPDQPDTIVLLHTLRGPVLAAVIAHEVRHLRQTRDGMPDSEREADADAFAAQHVRSA